MRKRQAAAARTVLGVVVGLAVSACGSSVPATVATPTSATTNAEQLAPAPTTEQSVPASTSEQPVVGAGQSMSTAASTGTNATWSLKTADGDSANVTMTFGPLVVGSDPRVPQISSDCLYGQLVQRQLAAPVSFTVNLTSSLPVVFVPNFRAAIYVPDLSGSGSSSNNIGLGSAVWVDSQGNCGVDGGDVVSGWNLGPGASTGTLQGWVLTPGVTPDDPTGARSTVHSELFQPNFLMGGNPPSYTAAAGSTLVSCTTALAPMPLS